MPRDALRVAVEHLRDLARRHDRAADGLAAATSAPADAGSAVSLTHGSIATGTAVAVDAVLAARRTAGDGLAAASRALHRGLTDAAARYAATDEAAENDLDQQVRPR